MADLPRLRGRVWWAAVAGAVAATGLAPFDFWYLAIPAFAVLAWLHLGATTTRRAAAIAWAAGTGYFAVSLNWIVEPFLVEPDVYGWMAPFAVVFMAIGLGMFWAAAAAAAQWTAPRGAWRLVVWVVALTVAEIARGVVLTGFPWALIGHVLIGSPLVYLAAWAGPDGLTLCVLALAAGLVRVADGPVRVGIPFAVLLGGLIWTVPMLAPRPPETPADAPVLRLVQPNAPQNEKWRLDRMGFYLDRQLEYTAAAPAPDVVIWPETSVPARLPDAAGMLKVIAEQAGGAITVAGILRDVPEGFFNSMAVVGPDGSLSAIYDKHHLVPFGEYVPFGEMLADFGIRGMAVRDGNGFSPGAAPGVVDLGRAGRAIALICYEAVFPRDVAAAARLATEPRAGTGTGAGAGAGAERPDFLLQITNDAWFGTFSGPYQHLAQARLRAIEQGLPMVRAANTGISAVIDATGRITGMIPLGEAGYLDRPRPSAAPATVYARLGGWPVTLLALGLLCIALMRKWRNQRGGTIDVADPQV